MKLIDAHQHFWRLDRGDYGWLTPAFTSIYRDFLPRDLLPLMQPAEVEGTILVQAAPTEAETAFLLSLADEHAFILGVVGWTDFEAAGAPGRIAASARHRKLKGLRPMIQDIPDARWMLRPVLDGAFRAMMEHGLAFDALVLPRHLEHLSRLLERYPSLRTVIDHCAKPSIARQEFAGWAQDMCRLADNTDAYCKLSGLMTEAGDGWTVAALRPYVDHVLDAFGPGRLIWGSDWPVCTINGADYAAWVTATDLLLADLSAADKAAILHGNAAGFYRLMA